MAYPKRIRPKIVPKNCPFCKEGYEPIYKNTEVLGRYISDRGKILSHLRTGICSTHQRMVSRSIKHARNLSLLSFVKR